MIFAIRMNDSGYKEVHQWHQLLSECKQAKSFGACWGYKTKK